MFGKILGPMEICPGWRWRRLLRPEFPSHGSPVSVVAATSTRQIPKRMSFFVTNREYTISPPTTTSQQRNGTHRTKKNITIHQTGNRASMCARQGNASSPGKIDSIHSGLRPPSSSGSSSSSGCVFRFYVARNQQQRESLFGGWQAIEHPASFLLRFRSSIRPN